MKAEQTRLNAEYIVSLALMSALGMSLQFAQFWEDWIGNFTEYGHLI